MIEEIRDLGEITRLVLMIELHPLSDKYMQVKLDRETFRKISAIAWEAMPYTKGTRPEEDRKTILVEPMDPVLIPNLKQADKDPVQ